MADLTYGEGGVRLRLGCEVLELLESLLPGLLPLSSPATSLLSFSSSSNFSFSRGRIR